MPLIDLQLDHEHLLAEASKLLDQPVRAVEIQLMLADELRKHLKPVRRAGIDAEDALVGFHDAAPGHTLIYGLEQFRLGLDNGEIELVFVSAPVVHPMAEMLYQFWAVPHDQVQPLYRFLRKLRRRQTTNIMPPILADDMKQQLWNNTLGFLQRGKEVFAKYQVPLRRGVLLLGPPGNGKSLYCRWLRSEATRLGFAFRTVSVEDYESASACGRAAQMFHLGSPGVVLFDDFDFGVREPEGNRRSRDLLIFLAGLGGMQTREGVVYVFTSNAELAEFDPAFCRPGRIDQVIQFPKPSAELRRQLVAQRWHSEIQESVNLDQVIEDTDGLSFAEQEELKGQLVIGYLETERWDWAEAVSRFSEQRAAAEMLVI